ncbi:MAG: hypothetical protein U0559_16355 [Anaerolineae bacterium]
MGLLSAGPALISLLIAIPIGRWLERRALIRTTYLSSIWFRLGYVAAIWLLRFPTAPAQISGYVLVVLLMSIPGTVLAIGFNATLAATVPPDWRAHVIGCRNALMAFSMTANFHCSASIARSHRVAAELSDCVCDRRKWRGVEHDLSGRIHPIGS